ncbi:putative reverse transcriptase domain-containing protein [Tanacetum coccineum]|uniref:Reverse transcriptase domain-containing protein n=1 Tax=Tanacetum coccineum TaxID=301880 RepID=A0ABQ4X6F2_9ASTR
MCMKETSLMLTMLIPGPKSPAKDIDVYLQPLIKELQELWKGVWTKDAATEVDASPVNDDNANANEGNAEDDVYAHVLDDDDDVVVSDDDEVNPSTNVEEVLSSDDSDDDNDLKIWPCVIPRSQVGIAGGIPPRRPNRSRTGPVHKVPTCYRRRENASLRRAFRQKGQLLFDDRLDYGDLEQCNDQAHVPEAFSNPVSREELDRILRQKDQEAELLRKQTAEAQQRAYLAALKADAHTKKLRRMYGSRRVMSSPNHPTSDIEDAFSSNFLDYIPASPDYFPASPENTYSSSSNNSFGVVPIASPTLLLFHNDPYVKVMQAFYAEKLPIPPPTIMPPSPMLSPTFNPQEFFLPDELLPLKKRGHDRSSSFTFALPQTFEMGESSHKTGVECYEE